MARYSVPPITADTPAEAVLSVCGVNADAGLSRAEVRRRRRRHGDNRIYDESRTSILRYLGYCSFDLLLILLLLTAAVAAVFGEREAYSVIIPILAVSIVLRTVAYATARRYLESCASAPDVMPGASVLREGEMHRADARSLVRGDIVHLRAGDIVPADCRLISSRDLVVFEEQVTGTPGAVRKDANLQSRANTVYAGSSVVGGSCVAVVIYTGADTLVVRTRGRFQAVRGKMRLSRLLDSYSRKWGALMAVLAFAVTVIDMFFGERGLYEAFFLGLSLAVAANCEYYSAFGDIAAAWGALRLRRTAGVAVRGVQSIEAAEAIDTIITPAEGVIASDGIACEAYFFDGEVHDVTSDDGDACDVPEALLHYAAMTSPHRSEADDHVYSEAARSLGEYLSYINYDADVFPDDGDEKPLYLCGIADGLSFDTRLLSDGDGFLSVSCGDAAAVAGACAFVSARGSTSALTEQLRAGIGGFIAYHERRGAVAVGVAKKRTPFHSRERMMFTQTDMELVGILLLYKPLAEHAAVTVTACRRAGIRVIMTGSGTASARLADRVGIISSRDGIITGREFRAMTKSARADAVSRAGLLLGFDGGETAEFIGELQARGHHAAYVAVAGADQRCGLSALGASSMGIALSDAADTMRMHSTVSVPPGSATSDGAGSAAYAGGISSIAETIAYSKRIYRNISNAANYLLTSQAARIFAVLLTVLFKKSALGPEQILLWGLIFDLSAVFVLLSERPGEGTLRDKPGVYERLSHPLSRIGAASLYGILWAVFTVFAPMLYSGAAEMGATIIFVSVLISLVVVCGEHRSEVSVFSGTRRPRLAPLLLAFAVAVTVMAITVYAPAASAFSLVQPDASALLISVIPAAVLLASYEVARLIGRKTGN